MQGFWRVIKAIWPYRFKVLLSFICAIGVSFSYASGVATLFPVMKIFLSSEGVHGWANLQAVQDRLGLELLPLYRSVQHGSLSIVVRKPTKQVLPVLKSLLPGDQITQVRVPGPGGTPAVHHSWLKMMAALAEAPPGSKATLAIAANGRVSAQNIAVVLAPLHWKTYILFTSAHWLPHGRFQSLMWIVVVFISLCIVGSIFRYYQTFLSSEITLQVVIAIRRRLFDRILDLPISYTVRNGTNDLISRITVDTASLYDGVSMLLGRAILEPTKAIGVAIMALLVDWRLFVGTLILLPPVGIVIRKLGKRINKAMDRGLRGWSEMVAVSNEALANIRVVKAYSSAGYERRRFARANRTLFKSVRRVLHYLAVSRPAFETMTIMLVSVPLILAAHLVLDGSIDKYSFFLVLGCLLAIFDPLRKLNDVNNKIQMAKAAANRCFAIIDLPPEENLSHTLPRLPRHSASIVFEHVSFKYPGHDEMVLRDVDFTVQHGQMVAVVGTNGSGKTTLLSLLPRLYPPTTGRVLVDGIDTAGVSLASLRKQIGLVTQETALFADTAYNNIAYGARHASRQRVLEAAQRSFADEFIRAMPQGYDTPIGQGGARLSGGQRQRIAIARAILRDPAILILDEALSQVDAESEAKISQALEEFRRDRTTFVIAHRFSTVVSADLIVCLDQGVVAGMGRHDDLLKTCEPYQRLCETQLIHGDAPANAAAAADEPLPTV